jgi:hypothetical protein
VALCTDPDGTISWLGDVGYETIFDGTVASGDPMFPEDAFLVRMTPQGKTESVATFAGNSAQFVGIKAMACAPGSYAMGGWTPESLDYGTGPVPPYGFLLKRSRP